jgi:hypothetical protein
MNALSFKRINPVQAHTEQNFANSLEFNFTMGSNNVLVWDDSYLAVKIRMQYSANGAFAVLPDTVGLSNAPLHCLFSDASLRLNNKEVSRLSDYSQSAYIHQLLTQSAQKQDNNGSGNPISLDRRWAEAGGLTAKSALNRRKQSLGIQDVAGIQTFTLAGKIPIFLTKEESGQNQNYLLRLVVNPNWRNRMTTSTGANSAVLASTSPITGTALAGDGVLYLDVIGMTLNIRTYETTSIPRSMTKTYMYSEFFSSTRAITNNVGSQRYTFTLPKTVSSIFFTMFDSREAASGTLADIANFPTRFVCDGIRRLTSYELRYAGTTLPSLKYQLELRDVDAAVLDRAENNDAYTQFIRDSMDLSPNGSQFSGVDWASQPIFYHSVVKPPGSEAPQVDLELVFSGAVPNTILYLGAFIPSAVDVSYNDTGTVSSVDVYQTSE